MNIAIDAMATAGCGDLLNIDLIQLRGSPFFPGLTAPFNDFLHMQLLRGKYAKMTSGPLHPMFLSYYIFKLWQ